MTSSLPWYPPLQPSPHLTSLWKPSLSPCLSSVPRGLPRPPTATDYPVSLSDYLLHIVSSLIPTSHPSFISPPKYSSPLSQSLLFTLPHNLSSLSVCSLSSDTPPTLVADCHAIIPPSPLQSPRHSLGFKLHLADLYASAWQMTLKWFGQL